MIIVQETLISQDLFDKQFVCNLDKCKGACCVEGDSGAPLKQEDIDEIEKNYDKIKPFMSEEGIKQIEEVGFYEKDSWDGEYVTTCQPNSGECNFVVYNDKGITECAIENAYKAGEIDYKKPISCHLYPIRIAELKTYTALNYHKWDICSPACSLGEELKVPVYQFLKDAIIRRFGEDYYKELELINESLKNQ